MLRSLLYVYVCVHVCFFMKSLTNDFDDIDNFVTFGFMLGRVITFRKQLQKINSLNRDLQAPSFEFNTPLIVLQYFTDLVFIAIYFSTRAFAV